MLQNERERGRVCPFGERALLKPLRPLSVLSRQQPLALPLVFFCGVRLRLTDVAYTAYKGSFLPLKWIMRTRKTVAHYTTQLHCPYSASRKINTSAKARGTKHRDNVA